MGGRGGWRYLILCVFDRESVVPRYRDSWLMSGGEVEGWRKVWMSGRVEHRGKDVSDPDKEQALTGGALVALSQGYRRVIKGLSQGYTR